MMIKPSTEFLPRCPYDMTEIISTFIMLGNKQGNTMSRIKKKSIKKKAMIA